MKQLFHKYRELILYVVFGALTTLINIASYWLFAHPLSLSTDLSTALAWIASVLFAYVTNRVWVFEHKSRGFSAIAREVVSFFACRLLSGLMDLGIMELFVEQLALPDMPVKLASNVLVIVVNYVASKFFIFARRK